MEHTAKDVPIVEPVIVIDTYADDLYEIQDMGNGNHRFVFTVRQKTQHGPEDWVVLRLVGPSVSVPRNLGKVAAHFGLQLVEKLAIWKH